MTTYKYKRSNNDIERLQKALNNSSFEEDTRFWKPTVDKAGSGFAVIRFLPAAPQDGDEGLPWAKLFTHYFQGPTGRYYVENSLTTLPGQKDPVSDYNNMLWNSTQDDNSPARKQARDQKRKLTYISNILVVDDPANPKNNGKVFLFKYGKKIHDKIDAKMHPKIEGRKPVNVFDPFEGANFELTVKRIDGANGKKGYPNYDDSQFEGVSAIADTEEEFGEIWNKQYSLLAFTAADQFKTYEELDKKLKAVLGLDGSAPRKAAKTVEDEDHEEETPPWDDEASPTVATVDNDEEEEDPDVARFKKIAAGL